MAPPSTCTDKEQKPAVVCVFCGSGPGKNPIHLDSARRLARCLHDADVSLVYGGGTRGIMGELARTLVSLYRSTDDGRCGGGGGVISRVHGVIPRALIQIDPEYVDDEEEEEKKEKEKEERKGNREIDDGGGGSGHKATDTADETAAAKKPERDMSARQLDKLDPISTTTANTTTTDYGTVSVVPDMHTRKQQMAQMVIEGGKGSGFVALAGGYGTIEEVMEMVTWNQLGIHGMPIVLVNVGGYWDGLLQWVRRAVEEGFVSPGNADILVQVKDPDEVVMALREYRVSEGRFQLDWSRV